MGTVPDATWFTERFNPLEGLRIAGIANKPLGLGQGRRTEEVVIHLKGIAVGVAGPAHDAGARIINQQELFWGLVPFFFRWSFFRFQIRFDLVDLVPEWGEVDHQVFYWLHVAQRFQRDGIVVIYKVFGLTLASQQGVTV